MDKEEKPRNTFTAVWIPFIGIICIMLPYGWWPRKFSVIMLFHIIPFLIATAWISSAFQQGGAFDRRRSIIRGFVGMLVLFVVLASSILFYRWLLKID